jgi:allantoate deiminase
MRIATLISGSMSGRCCSLPGKPQPDAMTAAWLSLATARVVSRLDELFAIGGGKGANRPGLSPAEQQAHDLAAGWMAEAGLEVAVDTAGNLIGRAPGRAPELPEVWTGSHLDTVPNGGRFDGALGVVAGLEAVTAASGEPQGRTIAVVAFRDEEGWRFGQGYFGSRALCGRLEADAIGVRDASGVTVGQALAALGLPPPDRPVGPLPGAFIELHIEQGNSLAEQGLALGVVSEIVAMAGLVVRFSGERAHAGGTDMTQRRDALVAAARFVLGAQLLARSDNRWRATVGELSVGDPAANVIADQVSVSVDARARSDESLDTLIESLRHVAAESARRDGCGGDLTVTWHEPAVSMSSPVTAELAAAAGHQATDTIAVTSWAGHDAGILAAAGVPVGMLFVRAGQAGVSHSPRETVAVADISAAVAALAKALAGVAGQTNDQSSKLNWDSGWPTADAT